MTFGVKRWVGRSRCPQLLPPWGYVVIRFLADNEGIWKLHCHILWHAASGMSMAFQVLGDERKGFSDNRVGLSAPKY
jgi:hypothetical protein